MSRAASFIACLCICAGLSACVAPVPVRESGPIHIGMYADLSSTGARDGNDAAKGAQLRVDQANESGGIGGRMVDLTVLDMKQSPTEAVRAFTSLAQERGVSAVIGSSVPNAGLAVSPVADLVHVPLVSLSIDDRVTTPDLKIESPDVAGQPRQYTFLVQPSAILLAGSMASYAVEHFPLQRYATISDPTNIVSVIQARAFEAAIRKGGKVVAASLEMPQEDFSAVLEAIKAARSDAVYVCGAVGQNAAFARQALDAAFQPVILGNQAWYAPLIDQAGKAADGAYFSTGIALDDPGIAEIDARFRDRYGEGPRAAVIPGWDAVGLILAAVRKAGSSDPLKVRDALEGLTGFKGLVGGFDMDKKTHRPALLSIAIMRIWSGQYTTVEGRYVPRQAKPGTAQ